jgi:hypothetical protein
MRREILKNWNIQASTECQPGRADQRRFSHSFWEVTRRRELGVGAALWSACRLAKSRIHLPRRAGSAEFVRLHSTILALDADGAQ